MKHSKSLALVLAAVMLLSLLLNAAPNAAAASSSEIRNQINELKKQKAQIRQEMEDLQSQFRETESEIENIVGRKNLIDQEIGLLYGEIANINQQITAFNLLIADKQDELDLAEQVHQELRAKNKDRIRTMEEEGPLSYWEVLFKAQSFSDLLDRLNMVREIAAADERRLEELRLAAQDVRSAREELETEKADLELTRHELDDTYAELEIKRQEAEALLAQMIERSHELEELYDSFSADEEALLSQIAQMEQAYNEAKHQEWLEYMATYTTVPPETTAPPTTAPPTTAPPTTEPSTTEPSATEPSATDPSEKEEEDSGKDEGNTGGNGSGNDGGNTQTKPSVTWLRPCSYTMVSSPFGKRDAPTAGASTYHQGIDLAAPINTPIYATRTGRVTIAGYTNSAGYYVSINHGDGYSSIYMHMTTYVVSNGQAVSAGQLIGYVGISGITTGPHLHFGISYNGKYINPASLINF